jgi:hypothetical protein
LGCRLAPFPFVPRKILPSRGDVLAEWVDGLASVVSAGTIWGDWIAGVAVVALVAALLGVVSIAALR